MINLFAIAVLRFAPLGVLLLFCLLLISKVKESLVPFEENPSRPAKQDTYYLVVNKILNGTSMPVGKKTLINGKISIGRAPGNQIVIPDPFVSGWHAQIEQKGGELYLVDLDSTNGTFVNGKKVKGKIKLKPKDSVAVGGILFGIEKGGEYADSSSDPRRVSQAEERG